MSEINILDVIRQPVFAQWFKDPETWQAWRAFLATLFALPMSPEELEIYRRCTGRSEPPSEPHREAWLICGRRSGKSFTMALTAMYLACFRDWRPFLAPGERATIMVIARDRDQAAEIISYLKAYFENVPMLAHLLENDTAESIELNNRVRIQVNAASYSRTRGYAIAVAILDEMAFWPTDAGSANPDKEILAAIRPAQVQFGDHAMLLCASSPYAKRGVLYEAHQRHYGRDGDPVLVWKAPTREMNRTIAQAEIDRAMERDPAEASAEFMAEFRSDLQSFVDVEIVRACTDNVRERLPQRAHSYVAFVDPSGGISDSMTLAISHMEGKTVVIDAVREVRAPFAPAAAVAEFAELLHRFQIFTVYGDRYAGNWPSEAFQAHGITYEPAELTKSELYLAFLPLLNSHAVSLIEHPRLEHQLVSLERKTTRGGRDTIDHMRGAHDDVANAVAGACVMALEHGDARPLRFLPSHAIGISHDPFLTTEENEAALQREEARLPGRFSGPGWAPTWHGSNGDTP